MKIIFKNKTKIYPRLHITDKYLYIICYGKINIYESMHISTVESFMENFIITEYQSVISQRCKK